MSSQTPATTADAPADPHTAAETTDSSAGDTPIESGAETATVDAAKRLEEEGEIAADYLEELLDIVDLDGDIDLDIDHGRAAVEIVAESEGAGRLERLVGSEGEVLDALQELTRLAVQANTGERSRLMLDVAGHRAARKAELTALAEDAIGQVRANSEDLSLSPMNPFERKVVHDAVAAAGLISDSEGVEPNRRVVIRAGASA